MGKPEPLRENLSGFWSRRIDDTNRLVYAVSNEFLHLSGNTFNGCYFFFCQVCCVFETG
ncbi:MAG: type II toxin-antitoxin system YoeB family toxin [Candidatus Aminicenantes bacterium]|nr:type II toxin-antitoxin system YoeB family toxin [Candidatus Aminicenantes bacterium]